MKKKMSILFIVGFLFCLAPLTSFAAYFEEVSQNVTAYTASKYKSDETIRKTASGQVPQNGFVAMQSTTVNKSGYYGVPFGSDVDTPKVITNYAGYDTNSYEVQDTGVSSSLTPYAIDIWWGYCRTSAFTGTGATKLNCSTSDAAYKSAINFGKDKMNLEFFTNR